MYIVQARCSRALLQTALLLINWIIFVIKRYSFSRILRLSPSKQSKQERWNFKRIFPPLKHSTFLFSRPGQARGWSTNSVGINSFSDKASEWPFSSAEFTKPWRLSGQRYRFQPLNRLCCTGLGHSKSQKDQNWTIGLKMIQQCCWMGGFCLLVEFHCEGSAINRATPV